MDPLTVKLASMRLAPRAGRHVGPPRNDGPSDDRPLPVRRGDSSRRTPRPTTPSAWSTLPHLGVCYEPLAPAGRGAGPRRARPAAGRAAAAVPGHAVQVLAAARRRVGRDLPPRGPVPAGVLPPGRQRGQPRNSNSGSSGATRKAGLRFADCVTFVPTLDRARFFGLMQRAHLMLDTLGFSGFNTAIQAIECGLPVVSREGEFMRGRLGSGILRRMGMDALVATTDAAYVELAVTLARDARAARASGATKCSRAAACCSAISSPCARSSASSNRPPRPAGQCKLRAVAAAFANRMMEAKPLSRIVLGLTGGIAAYKAAELTRLFVKEGVARRRLHDRSRVPLHHPADAAGAVRPAGAHRPLGLRRRQRDGPHRPVARRRCDRRRAGLGGLPREDRQRPRRRPPVHADARARLPAVRRARDESADVGERREPAQRRDARRRRRRSCSAPAVGDQACGETGDGRMLEPEEIFAAVDRVARSRSSSPASACCSPRARRSKRSIRCAASPTRARARWASRSRRRPPRPARS